MPLSKVALTIGLAIAATPAIAAGNDHRLDAAFATIKASRFVDLTHSFAPGIPHWKGFPDGTDKTIYKQAKDGFTAQVFSHVGQFGTHVDPPAHFHEGLKTVDQIDPREFLLKLVVLDIHAKVLADPDSNVTMDDVRAWEKKHGPIPRGAFVALRSDWSKRWPNNDAFLNRDAQGLSHYPGWTKPVLAYLLEERGATAIGHETSDTDPGLPASKGDFSLESYVLGTNHYQIEYLANLDQVPEAGALVMVTFPKPQGGTGFPARVVAILP